MSSKSTGVLKRINQILRRAPDSLQEKLKVETEPSQWSYVHGACARPLVHKTVNQILQRAVETVPNRNAFVFPSRGYTKTYLELWDESRRLAHGLLYLGLRPGDRLAIWSPNCYEWILTQYAAARAGLILVCVNSCYKASELSHVLKKVGAKALICPEEHRQAKYYEIFKTIASQIDEHPEGIGHFHHNELYSLKHLICFDWKVQYGKSLRGAWNFWQLVDAGSKRETMLLNQIDKELQPDADLTIMFTSGKTGRPKASTLSHHNVVNNVISVGKRMSLNEERNVICTPVPLHGAFGGILGSLSSVIHYSTCVVPCSRFSPAQVLKSIEDHKCNVILGTPTIYHDLMNDPHFNETDLTSLKTGICTGARITPVTSNKIKNSFKLDALHNAYGTTEVSTAAFMTFKNDDVNTVGPVLDHVEAQVVDVNGHKVERGVVGELCIRGYSVMSGYWDENVKEKNRGVQADRWYRTGDLASMDKEGKLTVHGRAKNVINRGGEAIYAKELENFLHDHPAISDVHVIPVCDKRLGEEICAWVELKQGHENTTAESIVSFCKGQVADFKIPRYIIFKKDVVYPSKANGRIDRRALRKLSEKTLGIHD